MDFYHRRHTREIRLYFAGQYLAASGQEGASRSLVPGKTTPRTTAAAPRSRVRFFVDLFGHVSVAVELWPTGSPWVAASSPVASSLSVQWRRCAHFEY